MNRKTFLKTTGLIVAGGMIESITAAEERLYDIPAADGAGEYAHQLYDLHVHRSDKQSIEDIVAKSKALNIRMGVMENIAPWGIRNDEELKAYIDAVKDYPVYIGLQPMTTGWYKSFSPELVAQADYVIMDPQTVTSANGYNEKVYLWDYDVYIDDPEYFIQRNMEYYLEILTGDEPLNIFACPLLLPFSIEREYDKLWTKQRMQQIIDAAKARDIAIEINDMMRVPHEQFIVMAKRAGLKFAFGSDTRDQKTGRLDYCKRIAARCSLTPEDLFIPERSIL